MKDGGWWPDNYEEHDRQEGTENEDEDRIAMITDAEHVVRHDKSPKSRGQQISCLRVRRNA